MSAWVHVVDVSRRLKEEASCTAARLGHRMSSWVAAKTERQLFIARCMICDDVARVSVRNPHRSPIAGAAVELRCVARDRSAVAGPAAAVPANALLPKA
jgi:hypothetical protein